MHLQKDNFRISHVILLFDIGLCNDEISSSTVIVLFHKKDALPNSFFNCLQVRKNARLGNRIYCCISKKCKAPKI